MHFTTFIVATLAAVASAGPAMKRQAECPEAANIPACGVSSQTPFSGERRNSNCKTPQAPCILAAATQIGCATNDYPCMCSKFSDLRSAAAVCVYTNCGLDGISAVLTAADAVCAACA